MTYFEEAQQRATGLMQSGHATLLSIETSCDETAAAVVRDTNGDFAREE